METANAKKCLMDSLNKLQNKANQFDELARLSERLIEKFERSEDLPKNPVSNKEDVLKANREDIVDMFNTVNIRLDSLLNRIGSNLERAINYID